MHQFYRRRDKETYDGKSNDKTKDSFIDEPLAALDPLVIQDIQKYILKFNQVVPLFL